LIKCNYLFYFNDLYFGKEKKINIGGKNVINKTSLKETENTDNRHRVISSFEEILDQLPTLFEEEISFTLTDKERFVKFTPSKNMPAYSEVGKVIPKGEALREVIESGKIKAFNVDNFNNMSIRVVAIPLKDEKGNVVGAISYGKNLNF